MKQTMEIKAARGLVPLNLREIWEYRELIFFFIWRDLKGRYRQMAFGPLWIVLTPVMGMCMHTIIFGKVAKLPSDGIPYPLFNFAALLPWAYFTSCADAARGAFHGHMGLISKVYFPRLIAPIVGAISGLVDFGIRFLILLAMMFYLGYAPGWGILLVPVFLLLAAVTGLAVGIWWASWVVHFRDITHFLEYILRAWMYATPVVYAASVVPERWRPLYNINPMTVVINGMRWALLGVGEPPGLELLWCLLAILPVLVAGAYYFRRAERTIVDIA